jgi:malate permease and related proteins
MQTTQIVFSAIIPIFFIIGAGAFARRIGWLNEEADRSLMAIVVNLFYPALIFSFILANDALRDPANLLLPPLVGMTTIIAGFGVSMLVARKFKIGTQKECRTFAFTTGIYNYGYFAIPIATLLFDRETVGILLVYNVGVEIAMWALGVGFILSANDPKSIWRRIFSAPVIAILIAAPLNFFQFDQYLPNVAFETIGMLGKCAIPLGLILIGATFADLSKGTKLFSRMDIAILSTALRVGIFPASFIFFALIFPLSIELKHVLIVQAAMPCGVFPIVLARHFDGSPEVALKVVLSTTLVSILTIPIWISVGLRLLDT